MFSFPTLVNVLLFLWSILWASWHYCIRLKQISFIVFMGIMERNTIVFILELEIIIFYLLLFLFCTLLVFDFPLTTHVLFTGLCRFLLCKIPFFGLTPGQTPYPHWTEHILALFLGQIVHTVCVWSCMHVLVKWKSETPRPPRKSSSQVMKKERKKKTSHGAYMHYYKLTNICACLSLFWSLMCAAWLHLSMFHILSALYTEINKETSAEEENVSISWSTRMHLDSLRFNTCTRFNI